MSERRKRLIEVAFPLEEVSAHSAHEKNVKQGHISMLHVWWARRPLAACRSFIYASLVDDPQNTDEREELLKEVADLASWSAVRHPDRVVRAKEQAGSGLTGRELLNRARTRILDCNGGKPPMVLDSFAGGGAIPLEALRLGCEVDASDLNPVAVLILKGTVEYPQKYGQANKRPVPDYILEVERKRHLGQASFFDGNLAEEYSRNPLSVDVRYWGNWVLEKVYDELRPYYPPDDDGSVPSAYIWSRSIECPSCGAAMPLIRQFSLARTDSRHVTLKPVVDRARKSVDFDVVEDQRRGAETAESTASHGDSRCLVCSQVTKGDHIRKCGRDDKITSTMTAVVSEPTDRGGKRYRSDNEQDRRAYEAACGRLIEVAASHGGELPFIPDEPIAPETLGLRIDQFGMDTWAKLYNPRQLLALGTFARQISEVHPLIRNATGDSEYADAVATYLAFALDRFANTNSTLTRLMSAGARGIVGTFARQALSMIWDYAEANPFGSSASWASAIDALAYSLCGAVQHDEPWNTVSVTQRDADSDANYANHYDLVLTDPPYYNAIDYAGLSDFFYVWLKRSLRTVHPDLLSLPLTPKREQAIMASESNDDEARRFYVKKMTAAFKSMGSAIGQDGAFGVVFAHTDPEAWATLIEGLLVSGLVPDASWPIDTELKNKTSAAQRANLQTSVWMYSKPRESVAKDAFIADVMTEMRPVIRDRLLYFWSAGIRGADFFISAIGPALSVFGRHTKVMRPDGTDVTVRDFLDLVRRESTHIALEQVLQGADLGVVDPSTQQYVTWIWSYSRAPLDAGEAIALCLATGADYGEVVRAGSIASEVKEKSKKLVKLRTIKERGERDENLGLNQPARPAPLIDLLQRSAWLWSLNRADELASYRAALGETRWQALRTLGQAVAECLPEGDDDRRLINGLLSSSVMGTTPPKASPSSLDAATGGSRRPKAAPAGAMLPGLEEGADGG